MLGLAIRMRKLIALIGLMLVNPGIALAQTEPGGDLVSTIKSKMHLANVRVQQITAPLDAWRGVLTVPLNLDGLPVNVKLVPDSQRAPGYKLMTRGADGAVTEIEAPPPCTWRGQIVGLPGSQAAASIVDGKISMQIDDGQATWWVQPLSDAIEGANAQQHFIYKQSEVLPLPGISCGLTDAHQAAHIGQDGGAALGTGLPPGCIKQAEIAFDADFEYFQLFDPVNNPNAAADVAIDIDQIMGGVNFIYRRDCGITHLTTMVIVQTAEPDPYSATDGGALLGEFQNHWQTNNPTIVRDVAHLFTGKDITIATGNIIGIAWLPGVCTPNSANPNAEGYGISESRFSSMATFSQRVQLTAHELGHNWNAPHCGSTGCTMPDPVQPCEPNCSIMCKCLSGCVSSTMQFEQCSADIIIAYRDTLTCLGLTGTTTWTTGQLTATDVLEDDRYGTSVAINGNLAIVGAGSDDGPIGVAPGMGTEVGSAYIYRFDGTTWIEEIKLHNPLPWARPSDRFGSSVDITTTAEGDVAVVGAYLWDFVNVNMTTQRSSGVAYVYRNTGTGWSQTPEAQLIPSDHFGGDFFGHTVAVSGDLICVGAEFNDDMGFNSGSAYIFRRGVGGWSQEVKLLPVDGMANDNFGIHVDVQEGDPKGPDDVAVVGAWADDDPSESGSAYVFRNGKSGWVQEDKITANDAAEGDRFGFAVRISGSAIVVGAPFADNTGSNSGTAYIFRNSGGDWAQEAELTASDAAAEDQFGFAVDISGDAAVVGAYLHDSTAATDTGAAYVFRNIGASWTQESLIVGPTTMADEFGYSVGISAGNVIIGAWLSDNPGPVVDGGSVYIGAPAQTTPTDCNNNGAPDNCDIALGTSMDVNMNGIPDECEMPPNNCPADVSVPANGVVNIDDLLVVITNWGSCPLPCPPSCPADITMNCVVNIDDLLAVVTTWGVCPPPP